MIALAKTLPALDALPLGRASEDGMLKNACWLYCQTLVHRYLMANAEGRWDGAEKAQRHREMCCFYVAAHLGIASEDDVELDGVEYKAVHEATQALTDRLDEAIGFPVEGRPDYDTLAPLFFERFHDLAMTALGRNTEQSTYPRVPDVKYREILDECDEEILTPNAGVER